MYLGYLLGRHYWGIRHCTLNVVMISSRFWFSICFGVGTYNVVLVMMLYLMIYFPIVLIRSLMKMAHT